ncbi:MAG TPA: MOSC and FAD-binding oxidoreductase domain-containing protein [Solirubrobacterales bacterium]|nr:MOSC and FAD-binding oxidoreductase domain-containing protein [Solirubrobacterales bacterium]
MDGKLISLNVGMPRDVAWQGRTVHTAIWKQPVAGPRMVRRLNIDGDGQGDLDAHGGEHRAVYVYQLDSYAYWERELGREGFAMGQFGENLTVDGLADEEVCIGDRFRIGAAEFEVTQPRVTCYRLGMRMEEPQMPALLVAHRRPGFYFRVITEGPIEAGDEIERIAAGPEAMSVAAIDSLLYKPGRARRDLERATRIPPLSKGWRDSFLDLLAKSEAAGEAAPLAWEGFRSLRVAAIRRESTTIASFELEDPAGALPAAAAGQYVTVRIRPDDAAPPLMRSYSLSCETSGGRYRISVKRDGVVSGYLHDQLEVGATLEVAAPRGSFVLPADERHPVVLVSAGVGATPVLAMLTALVAAGRSSPVWWIHCARDAAQHAFGAEVDDLLARLPDAHRLVLYSRGEAPREGRPASYDGIGRLTPERLAGLDLAPDADYFICGPDSFMDDLSAGLLASGVAPERVHTERFGSRRVLASGVVAEERPAPHQPAGAPGTGPLVSFARSGLEVRWSDEHRSLLELAEACDVPADFGCRTGVCHICATGLLSGGVEYSPPPLESPPPDQVLLCCSAPSGEIALDL